jgi:mitofilin
LRTQLRRQAAALTDHLNDVLKVQEAELNRKHDGHLREKLLLAKQESELKLRGTLARLNGIISAIRNRADTEKHNVEAQELWLACHSLSTAIIGLGDDRDRPYPIHSEVESIRRVTNDNEVVDKVLNSLSDDVLHRGVYTEESLRRRFPKVKRICRQVAMVGDDGAGVWSYLISYLQSLFVFETRIASPPTSIDPEELDTYKVLSLATYALENGDTEQAVKYMNQLRGEPRRVAKDWIREARLFLEGKQVARFLTSFASAYNIGVEQQK